MDLRRQDQSCRGNGPVKLFVTRTGSVRHRGAGLGHEVLDDDLLDVSELVVRLGDRRERVQTVLARFTNAHEQARRKGDLELSGKAHRVQPTLGVLVRRQTVRFDVGEGLEHHALGGAHGAQLFEFVPVERSRVGVVEKPRTFEYHLRRVRDVVNGRLIAARGEPTGCFVVAKLRSFAQREERLGASGGLAGKCDSHDLVKAQVRRGDVGRRLGEGAVAAAVATELRERNEDLR